MDEGRDGMLAQGLRLSAMLAALLGLAVLASDPRRPFALDPVRLTEDGIRSLDVRVLAATVLVVAALVMLGGRVAPVISALTLGVGGLMALDLLAADPSMPGAIVVAVALAWLPSIALLLVFVIRWAADAAGEHVKVARPVAALLVVTLATAAIAALAYDPYLDPRCAVGCVPGHPPLAIDPTAHRWLNRWIDAVAIVASATTVVLVARWCVATRLRQAAVALGMLGMAALAVAGGLTVLVPDAGSAASEADAGPTTIAALGSAALAVGMAAWAWQTLRFRIRLERAADDVALAAGERPAAMVLADAFGRPSLELSFPLPDGSGLVDRDGTPVSATGVGEAGTASPVLRRGVPIAYVRPAVGAGAGAHLPPVLLASVDLERLHALRLAGLRALRASRARVVAAADAERRRIERDLHDGAQQRLLAVGMDLRLARTRAERGRSVTPGRPDAERLAFEALDLLRELARGIHPAILTQGGLGPALSSLAEEAPVPLTLHLDRSMRLPPLVEGIAYRSVRETLAAAPALGATEVVVAVSATAAQVTLDIELDGRGPALDPRLVDRVRAAGGTVAVDAAAAGRHRIRAVIPCA